VGLEVLAPVTVEVVGIARGGEPPRESDEVGLLILVQLCKQTVLLFQETWSLDVAWILGLINEIRDQKDEISLILDDFHLISSPRINQLMFFLIDHQPENLHLIISSRSDPNLPFARWRSQNRLVEIRAADLSFTIEESNSLFNNILKLGLSSDDISRLGDRTEGWVTGLQLAALSLQSIKDREGFIKQFHGDNRYVVDYLLEEVFNQQPDDVQMFLLQTSILDRTMAVHTI